MQTTYLASSNNISGPRFVGLMLACALLATVGCGGDRPTMAPVRGIVEMDGKPLTDFQYGAVTLTPQGGPMAKGKINPADGSFQLGTYDDSDGALIGPGRIAVSATVDDPNAGPREKHPGVRWVIPESFADRDFSGLAYEVVGGKTNVVRIKISSDGSGTVEAE